MQATRLGAFDFIEKPFTPDQLRGILIKAQKALNTKSEVKRLKEKSPELKMETKSLPPPPLRFTSDDAKSRSEFEILFRSAATPASILLLGESGTGKSVIAREIHERSHLRHMPHPLKLF